MRGEPFEERPETTIHVGLTAFVPEGYVADEKGRLEIYRAFERCLDEETTP